MKIPFLCILYYSAAVVAIPSSGIGYGGKPIEVRSGPQLNKRQMSWQCTPRGYLCYENESCCSGSCAGGFTLFSLITFPGRCVESSSSATPTSQISSMMSSTMRPSSSPTQTSSSSTTRTAIPPSTTEGATGFPPSSITSPSVVGPSSSPEISACLETGTRVIMIHTTVDFTTGELDRWTVTDFYTVSCSASALQCADPSTHTTVVTATDNIAKNDTASFSYGTRTVTYLTCHDSTPTATAPATADPRPTDSPSQTQSPLVQQPTFSSPPTSPSPPLPEQFPSEAPPLPELSPSETPPPQLTARPPTPTTTPSSPRTACLTYTEYRVSIVSTVRTRSGMPETDYGLSPYTTVQSFCFTRREGGVLATTTPRTTSGTMRSSTTSSTTRTTTTTPRTTTTSRMSMSMSMDMDMDMSMSHSMSMRTTVVNSSTLMT